MLSEDLIDLPTKGVVGFHPSKLPFDRGRSVLAWQIEEGYTETALTMFFYSTYPDGGDIIAQEKIRIEKMPFRVIPDFGKVLFSYTPIFIHC